MDADEWFDDIIVGAGASGCVVANRLSADPRHRVLLLEAGGGDANPLITMPKGIAMILGSPRWTWRFPVTQPRADGVESDEVWVRGRVIGGGSSINGMIYSRGHPLDYADWERLGGAGWGWDEMLAAYRAIEDHELGANEYRGAGGPLHIASGPFRYPLAEALIEAGTQAGLPRREDLNHPDLVGVGYYAHTVRRGSSGERGHGVPRPGPQAAEPRRAHGCVRRARPVRGWASHRCGGDRPRPSGDVRGGPRGRPVGWLGDVAEAARALRRRRRRSPPAPGHPCRAPQPARRREHAGPPHVLDAPSPRRRQRTQPPLPGHRSGTGSRPLPRDSEGSDDPRPVRGRCLHPQPTRSRTGRTSRSTSPPTRGRPVASPPSASRASRSRRTSSRRRASGPCT